MNDRELLELAARAAGIKARWFRVKQWRQVGGYRMQTGQEDVFGTHHSKPWNPLTDDGDALRLAVKLGLTVDIDLDESWTEIDYTADYQDKEIREGHGGGTDPYGATRLAIVRAAAEIGKSMGGGE
ncbi:hypothetical protein DZA07_32020 [Pseudomonas aeruginosa]|uniref:hypothetical protein n=1 Tax=Pseudomonas aeruginosa TaxID=287 RepID=UPI00070F269A|nr:hypothetical protein [Pseudomonas aeruginosa]MBY9800819.1 hypothetical protein [Pseudomonas aeruginosa]MDU0734565.1 hypothetical protein [Pseudomonas aeruginosa]PTZ87993.1 hypothetical protein DB391_30815 [Pseudomonas aeruginosa]RTW74095.1 hypothetical protein DZA07_32020 [Pseudomonas aeruginosa]WMU45478.1 hypothetical protein P4B24_18710 [Pseudomonas aeruginosa]